MIQCSVSICWSQISELHETEATWGGGRWGGSTCWPGNVWDRILCRSWQEYTCKERKAVSVLLNFCTTAKAKVKKSFQIIPLMYCWVKLTSDHVKKEKTLTELLERLWGTSARTWTGRRSPSVPSVWADVLCLGLEFQREFPSLCVETGTSPAGHKEIKIHTQRPGRQCCLEMDQPLA